LVTFVPICLSYWRLINYLTRFLIELINYTSRSDNQCLPHQKSNWSSFHLIPAPFQFHQYYILTKRKLIMLFLNRSVNIIAFKINCIIINIFQKSMQSFFVFVYVTVFWKDFVLQICWHLLFLHFQLSCPLGNCFKSGLIRTEKMYYSSRIII
jgi:hypothetical protein